jgi:hypothetical protein
LWNEEKLLIIFFLICNIYMYMYYKIKDYCDLVIMDIRQFFNRIINCCYKNDEEDDDRQRLLAIERLWEL